MMNSRERVLRAIRYKNPDRVPLTYSVTPGALYKCGEALVDLCRKYPNDFYDVNDIIHIPRRDNEHYRKDGSYYKEVTDAWGCVWVFCQEGISGEVKKSPLEDRSALAGYKFPPIADSSPEKRRRRKEEMDHTRERYVGWGSAGSFYEQMQWLRGVENLMLDIAEECDEVITLADRLLEEYLIPNIELALEAGADVVGFGDDWGTQTSLLINPRYWRKVFKPRYKRMFDLVHQAGALTWMHSDGMIMEILPDLMEIGLEVINPQCNCMDIHLLAKCLRGKMTIAPDIDRQHLLPKGTPDEVREYVRLIHDTFASESGGLIYTAGIYDDMPLENVEALLKAFHTFG